MPISSFHSGKQLLSHRLILQLLNFCSFSVKREVRPSAIFFSNLHARLPVGGAPDLLTCASGRPVALPLSRQRIQKFGDFRLATTQHGLAVAEQQHFKVVIEQFAQ